MVCGISFLEFWIRVSVWCTVFGESRVQFSGVLSVFGGFEGLFSYRIVDMSSSNGELGIEIPISVCVRV